jgi:hypothetical protein
MQFAAADGFTLHGTLYEGGPDAIVVASALGVKRRHYASGVMKRPKSSGKLRACPRQAKSLPYTGPYTPSVPGSFAS